MELPNPLSTFDTPVRLDSLGQAGYELTPEIECYAG